MSWWFYLAISSSAAPFPFYLQSFSASGSFPMSQFLASCGQSIGVSASASVLPMNIQGWFPLGLIGLISLQSKGLLRVFSNTRFQKHQVFDTQSSYGPTPTSIPDYWKNHSFDYKNVNKVMSLLFNTLYRLTLSKIRKSIIQCVLKNPKE